MGHVTLKNLLKHTRHGAYGIPNFWGGSIEKVIGHIFAANNCDSPLCLCHNQGLCPSLPIEIGVPLIVSAAEYSDVPVATILDHGTDFESIQKAIRYGISSVMFDGSHLTYEENLKKTKEVVMYAHAKGVSVEAELGAVGGSAVEIGMYADVRSIMTDPDQAQDFVRQTQIDALAISFGNVHGPYKGMPKLDLERVAKIARLVDVPLVMHGASGLCDSDYPRIIDSGISKINYYTALALKTAQNLKHKFIRTTDDVACHQVMAWNIEYITTETQRLLDLLRCSGKASAWERLGDERCNFDVEEITQEVLSAISVQLRTERRERGNT